MSPTRERHDLPGEKTRMSPMSTAISALLTKSVSFHQVFELRPCAAVPPLIEIRITSWYLDAKDPESGQVRFLTMATPEALLDLKNALEALLARSGRFPEPEGR
jgi:hypothetical protein